MSGAQRTALRLAQWVLLLPLGLMARFFFALAVDVAPAMTQLDAAGYLTTQQAIDRAVRSGAFAAAFFGPAVLTWLVAPLALRAGARRRALGWALVAPGARERWNAADQWRSWAASLCFGATAWLSAAPLPPRDS